MHWRTQLICALITVAVGQEVVPGVDDVDIDYFYASTPSTDATDQNFVPGVDDSELDYYFSTIQSTTIEDDDDCVCLPFYQCLNGTINELGVSIVDIRARRCPTSVEQCCYPKPPEEITETPLSPPDVPELPPHEPELPPYEHELPATSCGVRNVGGIDLAVEGGSEGESNFAEFPWMTALMVKDPDTNINVYKCGGSLIHHQVVLTAAHCIGKYPLNSWLVRAGEWDTLTELERYPYQDRGVQRIITHDHFRPDGLLNDIALLILDTPVESVVNIGIVCLPTQDESVDGKRCFATGWGKDKFGNDNYYQNILKRIELPAMPRDECVRAFRTTRLGQYFRLHSSFMCAGGEKDKDVCVGDGGGPLVCPTDEYATRYIQAGVVSWGIGCGAEGIPGAYASVAHVRNWIDKKMTELGFGTESYTSPDLS